MYLIKKFFKVAQVIENNTNFAAKSK